MAYFFVENQFAEARIIAFPKNWGKVSDTLKINEIYAVNVRVTRDNQGERVYTLIQVSPYLDEEDEIVPKSETVFRLWVPQGFSSNDLFVSRIKGLLVSHHGKTPVHLHVSKSSVINLPPEYGVTLSSRLIQECRLLFKEFRSR
jgi:DNA polymerase III alpha subunit